MIMTQAKPRPHHKRMMIISLVCFVLAFAGVIAQLSVNYDSYIRVLLIKLTLVAYASHLAFTALAVWYRYRSINKE